MSLNIGAFTTVGFRAWENVCHTDVTMNKADGMMEKNSCSKGTLKSNCSRLSFNNASPPTVKGILIVQARCMPSIQTGSVVAQAAIAGSVEFGGHLVGFAK